MKSLLFKKSVVWTNRYAYHNQVVIFHKLLFEVTKIGVRLINWRVYPARPSDTVTQYTIYPLSHWWKDYSNGLGPYLATLSYG